MAALVSASSGEAARELPRIAVREGAFVDSRGAAFAPRGLNYIRLRQAACLWHDTFSPASYDGPRAGRALEDMSRRGFNLVRVFVDHTAGAGAVATRDAERLSAGYMANVVDFLRRARASAVRVIFAMCYLAEGRRWRGIAGPMPAGVGGENAMLLSPARARAKATYMADFAATIKERERTLLTTVFSYELDNETTYRADLPPFSTRRGTFGFGDGRYDLASGEGLQRLADDAVVAAANVAVRAVRRIDPGAMVSANVFTFAAVGRTGPGRLLTDRTRDARFPARPLALARSDIHYLDIHLYGITPEGLERDLASVEWDELAPALRRAGKPVIMGEYGAFRHGPATADAAARLLVAHVDRVSDSGFAGHLLWTYDSDMQRDIWNAKTDGGRILEALTRAGAAPR
ncbi:MAG: hypothetical protein ACYS9X_22820 [Planctomycetota bacterium]